MTVVFYISGHGFGHAVRQTAILNAFAAARPDVRLVVRTSVTPRLFARNVPASARVEVQEATVDIGAVQRGSLDVDVAATVQQVRAFHDDLDARAEAEARVLEAIDARLVVSDIPAVAFAAATRCGLPAIGISNFTWDWIYEDYAADHPEAADLVRRIGACYAEAAAGWRLPMAGGFATFPVVHDLPLVARAAQGHREDTRRRLSLPAATPLVLVSLGGFGAAGLDLGAAARSLRGVADIVITSHDTFPSLPGVHCVDEAAMHAGGIRYEDLLAAVDAVASKPGYGIISDCAANGTSLLYTSRGRFREYDVLVAALPHLVHSAFIDQDDLVAGRWREPLQRLLAPSGPRPRPRCDGATVAAAWLSALVPL